MWLDWLEHLDGIQEARDRILHFNMYKKHHISVQNFRSRTEQAVYRSINLIQGSEALRTYVSGPFECPLKHCKALIHYVTSIFLRIIGKDFNIFYIFLLCCITYSLVLIVLLLLGLDCNEKYKVSWKIITKGK